MNESIALEHEEPTTVNEHCLASYKSKYHMLYTAARHLHVNQRPKLQQFLNDEFQGTDFLAHAVHNLHQMGFEDVSKVGLLRLLPNDKANDAIEIMSEVRAYYQSE